MRRTRSRKKRARIVGLVLLILVLFAGVSGAGALLWWRAQDPLGPANPQDKEDRLFEVKAGSSLQQIARDLEQEGLLKDERIFYWYARLSGNAARLKAGRYLLNPAMDARTITEKLVEGKVATITFTIPEGYHLRQIAEVFAQKGIAEKEEFWEAIQNGSYNVPFLEELPPRSERWLEGYLFPDTYTVPLGTPVEKVIEVMLKRFAQIYDRLPSNNTGLTRHELVTLASIVEGESVLDEERPIIASVFFNRLKIGQRLEADATVQYLFDERKERVLYRDLEIDSPYNTYRNKGLPPGPIGSPGEASLRAVLQPADTKYYYFVARKDNSGAHVFAQTLDEHNRNKRRLGY
ncbi:MAG TPA: endolytic transglycosylase MltG [Peptococcaceae bacterium]|nr:endolytic transglycosylase MltG [Peptococcaceae bacterium]